MWFEYFEVQMERTNWVHSYFHQLDSGYLDCFDEQTTFTIARDTLNGIMYLHDTAHIIHRDIKGLKSFILGINIMDFGIFSCKYTHGLWWWNQIMWLWDISVLSKGKPSSSHICWYYLPINELNFHTSWRKSLLDVTWGYKSDWIRLQKRYLVFRNHLVWTTNRQTSFFWIESRASIDCHNKI